MALTSRQKETVKHLKVFLNISEPDEIIQWCKEKLVLPHRSRLRSKKKIKTRSESVTYYQSIITHYEVDSGGSEISQPDA